MRDDSVLNSIYHVYPRDGNITNVTRERNGDRRSCPFAVSVPELSTEFLELRLREPLRKSKRPSKTR